MKFLCDNCKAKYQIADEKVAGKTVRMKCRKCGHQIEVRSAVTENSQSHPPPAPLPGVKAPPARPGLATPLSAAKPRPSNAGLPAQAGSALAGAFTKNVEEAPASTSRDQSIELSVTDEWYVAINGVPVGPVRISELRRKAATGAVNEESLCWQEGLEEWRPIRSIPELAQIVREAMSGGARASIASIGSMEAASPAAPAVRQSTPPAAPRPLPRQSSIPPAPLAPALGTAALPPAAPRPFGPSMPQRSNVVPLRPAAVTGPSFDDIPLSPVGGGASGGSAAAYAPSFSPFTPPAPQTSPLPVSTPMQQVAPPVTSPSPGIDPFRAPSGPMPAAQPFSMTPNPAPMSMSPSYHEVVTGPSRPSFHPPSPSFNQIGQMSAAPMPSVVSAPEKKGGVPLWFWPILVLFLGFGGGLAFLVYKQQAPAPVVIQMPPTATAATASAPPVNSNDIPPPDTSADTVVADNTPTTAGGGKKPKGKAGGGNTSAGAGQNQGPGLDLGNLGGGVGGPAPGPAPGGGGGGGGGLDQAGVEKVVSAHRAGVKRTCWERGGADQKSSVNVTVSANVSPNGSVSSTSSTGDDPVVGKCIENQVKIWQFPAPGSATTINIPFKFVRQ